MAVARPWLNTLTSSGTALVNDIIAPLHFADDPMQQTGAAHFVAAKLRRNVLVSRSSADKIWQLAAADRNRGRAVSIAVDREASRHSSTSKTRKCGNWILV